MTVDSGGADRRITLRKDNTLIGLNILVSLEYGADAPELGRYQGIVEHASDFLFNATDGQFFIEVVQLFDWAENWDDSDYRVFAWAGYRANVPNVVGGFLGQDVLGSAMKMSRSDDSATYVHEFGHFGFSVRDEYREPSVPLCTAPLAGSGSGSRFAPGGPAASCIMAREDLASKICSSNPDNPHVAGTRQGDGDCWSKISERYNWGSLWRIKSPAERSSIPGRVVFADGTPVAGGYRGTQVHGRPEFGVPPRRVFVVVTNALGLAVRGVEVKTKSRSGSGAWVFQGYTDGEGRAELVGILSFDRVRLDDAEHAHERSIPDGAVFSVVI